MYLSHDVTKVTTLLIKLKSSSEHEFKKKSFSFDNFTLRKNIEYCSKICNSIFTIIKFNLTPLTNFDCIYHKKSIPNYMAIFTGASLIYNIINK